MAIQSSGTIKLSEIQTEFGGSNPISLSEYYQDASPDLVTSNNTGVPNTGNAIDLSDFYGATNEFPYEFDPANADTDVDLETLLTSEGWDGSSPVSVTIPSDAHIKATSTSNAAITISSALSGLLTLTNEGKISGKGGQGGGSSAGQLAGHAGGPAITNNATNITLINASGAFIAGGGGGGGAGFDSNLVTWGGGGGAGGGAGGGPGGGSGGQTLQLGTFTHPTSNQTVPYMYGGGGGSFSSGGTRGSDGLGNPGNGGVNGSQSGAAGGSGYGYGNSASGAGGGLYGNSFTTMSGGIGGSGAQAGGGGGGWGTSGGGASGGGGGAGGAAIAGTAIATYTNNGTVYGSVA